MVDTGNDGTGNKREFATWEPVNLADLGDPMIRLVEQPDIARVSLCGLSVAHCILPAWEVGDYVSRSAAFSVGVSFTNQICDVEIGGRACSREVLEGSIVVTGADAPIWLRVEQPSDLVEVSADAALRASVADEYSVPDCVDLADLMAGHDPVAWALAARLRSLVRGAEPPSSLEVETLVRRFYARVLELNFGGRIRAKGDGGLDIRRAARIVEYIDAHLDEKLGLGALADIAALSPFHFHRSFRRTFGCTPHRYVAMRKARLRRLRPVPAIGRAKPDPASSE